MPVMQLHGGKSDWLLLEARPWITNLDESQLEKNPGRLGHKVLKTRFLNAVNSLNRHGVPDNRVNLKVTVTGKSRVPAGVRPLCPGLQVAASESRFRGSRACCSVDRRQARA
jgi:hypothetical protein